MIRKEFRLVLLLENGVGKWGHAENGVRSALSERISATAVAQLTGWAISFWACLVFGEEHPPSINSAIDTVTRFLIRVFHFFPELKYKTNAKQYSTHGDINLVVAFFIVVVEIPVAETSGGHHKYRGWH